MCSSVDKKNLNDEKLIGFNRKTIRVCERMCMVFIIILLQSVFLVNEKFNVLRADSNGDIR
jgi:hypothetical protein